MRQLLDRIVDAESATLIKAFEDRLKDLEVQQITLAESVKDCGRPLAGFDESFRTAFDFLGNPQMLRRSEHLEHKRMVLRMAFTSRLAYVRNEGFRTADLTLPFKALAAFKSRDVQVVAPPGLEPGRPFRSYGF